MLRTGAADTQW